MRSVPLLDARLALAFRVFIALTALADLVAGRGESSGREQFALPLACYCALLPGTARRRRPAEPSVPAYGAFALCVFTLAYALNAAARSGALEAPRMVLALWVIGALLLLPLTLARWAALGLAVWVGLSLSEFTGSVALPATLVATAALPLCVRWARTAQRTAQRLDARAAIAIVLATIALLQPVAHLLELPHVADASARLIAQLAGGSSARGAQDGRAAARR